jgi:hypothetical protein
MPSSFAFAFRAFVIFYEASFKQVRQARIITWEFFKELLNGCVFHNRTSFLKELARY